MGKAGVLYEIESVQGKKGHKERKRDEGERKKNVRRHR